MRVKVAQEKIAKALNNVSRVAAGSRTTLPILNNVLMRVDEGQMTLTTTNLDSAVVSHIPTLECENGTVTVPAKLIAEFISNLPRGEAVEIFTEAERMTIKSGGYSSTINGALADDFPELPDIDETKMVKLTVSPEAFKRGVGQVIVAASIDMARPALTGVYFGTRDGSLFLAATDGYRMSERKLVENVEAEIRAIVPAASLRTALGLLDEGAEEMEILFDETQVRFRMGEVEFTSKLIDAAYPDYKQLIPKDSEVHIVVEKSDMARVVKLAALFSKEVGGVIGCRTDAEAKTFSVFSVANEIGENSSEIKLEDVEKDAKVMMSAKYLLDCLNVMEAGTIRMRFSESLEPIVFTSENDKDFLHLLMPLKR